MDEKLIEKMAEEIKKCQDHDFFTLSIARRMLEMVRAHDREGKEELWIARLSKSVLTERIPISDAFKTREGAERYAESHSNLKLLGIFPIYLPRPESRRTQVIRELRNTGGSFIPLVDGDKKLMLEAAELLEAEDGD